MTQLATESLRLSSRQITLKLEIALFRLHQMRAEVKRVLIELGD